MAAERSFGGRLPVNEAGQVGVESKEGTDTTAGGFQLMYLQRKTSVGTGRN
jgi:hypothetical protein